MTPTQVRLPAVAGRFYPSEPEDLSREVEEYVSPAPSSDRRYSGSPERTLPRSSGSFPAAFGEGLQLCPCGDRYGRLPGARMSRSRSGKGGSGGSETSSGDRVERHESLRIRLRDPFEGQKGHRQDSRIGCRRSL